jgi:N-acetylmuramoyl-L-alanine amidase
MEVNLMMRGDNTLSRHNSHWGNKKSDGTLFTAMLAALNRIVLVALCMLGLNIYHAITEVSARNVFDSNKPNTKETSNIAVKAAQPIQDLSVSKLQVDAQKPQDTTGTINWAKTIGKAVIRTGPEVSNPILLEVQAGQSFPILKQTNDWLQVGLDENQSGWLLLKQASVQILTESNSLVQTIEMSSLYWGPDQTFGIAKKVAKGAVFIPEQISGQWTRISEKVGGNSLWIPNNEVQWTFGQPPAKEVLMQKTSALSESTSKAPKPLLGKTVIIDPGHGGKDPGAIGIIKPVYERDVNLSVALVLNNKLQSAGAHVIMTRTSNEQTVSLQQRVDISNENKADIFISIHQNMFAEDPSVSGTITYYDSIESKTLAQKIEAAATKQLNSKVEKENVEKDQLFVLKYNKQPAVLIEGSFMSNPQELEESLLPKYQEELATGIYYGILAYFNPTN